jgi:hypothetical protein
MESLLGSALALQLLHCLTTFHMHITSHHPHPVAMPQMQPFCPSVTCHRPPESKGL